LIWLHYKLDVLDFLALFPFTLLPSIAASLFLKGKGGKEAKVDFNPLLASLGALVLALSVALTREGFAAVSALLGFSIYVLTFKSLPQIDWKLLVLLALMMYDFGIIGSLVKLNLSDPLLAFLAVAGLSQAISNVPSTIIAMASNAPWKATILGADLGGLGTPIASLANLIAIRLASCDAKEFTKVNLTLLAVALAWGALLLTLGF